jgi:ribosomal protein S12 methylthiotransferase
VNDFPELARSIAQNKRDKYPNKDLFLYNDKNQRIDTTSFNSTFIKISEGCDMPCSFCSIPLIRGPYRSRTIDSIVKEAEHYKKKGYEEINLISQNSTYYGKDTGSESKLPDLLKEISSLDFKWVRILYLMPEEVNDKIIQSFSYPTVLPYFDLPFQHVNPGILKKMKRGGGFQKNLDLIARIRKQVKTAVIRSTFIVGFPGETEKDFEELARFAKESRIERIGVFGFSPEEKTKAFLLKNRISQKVTEDRKNAIMEISDHNIQQYNSSIINSIQEFIPLGPWENYSTIGRIPSQAPEVDGLTRVKTPFDESDKIYRIKIIGFENELLNGEKI